MDIIFAEPLDRYVEIDYDTKLRSVKFIKNKDKLTEKKAHKATFELDEYFKGDRKDFSFDIDVSGLSFFAQEVLYETQKIPYGKTITYSELADRIGTKSARAVGRALSDNPIPIVIPCHRVVAKNGIGGYSGGVDIKTGLLELEKRNLKSDNL
ncbi:MAG TPA: methylated-DNA--[protein]-cysteine S-methyltransferase [Candidatus Methanoperedens sp.]